MLEAFRELRLAARKLARAPLFTAVAVFTLAVGIGANAAIFSVVDGVLLKPLPYPESEQLVSVAHAAPGFGVGGRRLPLSEALYFVYRNENRVFQDLGIVEDGSATITGNAAPERVSSLTVTEGTLSLLNATPLVGRRFTASDDVPGAPATVILSNAYWLRRFGGDRGVIGQMMTIDGLPYQIIGVLPRRFRVLQNDPAIYLPARFDPAQAQMMSLRYQTIARLRPGVTITEANADLKRLIPIAFERYPGRMSLDQLQRRGFAPDIRPLREEVVGEVQRVLWILLGTVGLVLLLACANVANLFLVRVEARQREVALHSALGAGQDRIIASFLTESLLLSTLGGVCGLGLAYGGLALLKAVGPTSLPRMDEIGIDGRVLAFTVTASLLAGCLFGVFPAFRYGRRDLSNVLRQGAPGAGNSAAWMRARNGLVVIQVALALVLLIGSGLMIRSVRSLENVDPGFSRPDEVATFQLFVPETEIASSAQLLVVERQILDRLKAVPGVTGVSAAWSLPMAGAIMSASIRVEGVPVEPDQVPVPRRHTLIMPGYPETLLTPVVAGRTLTWADLDAAARVVLVSENLAREQWGSPQNALGKRIAPDGPDAQWYEIVGVLGNIRDDGVAQAPPPTVFWPLGEGLFNGQADRSLSVVVRAPHATGVLLPTLQRAVWSVNPNLPLANFRTLRNLLDGSMGRAAFAMVMLSLAAVVGLVLGVVGIYGVISYLVSQRTREIGVRIALGAEPGTVRSMVMRQAALVTGTGVVIGLAAAVGLSRLLAGLLHEVRPVDPITYGVVTAVILLVALAASYLPARRAAAIAPMVALRSE